VPKAYKVNLEDSPEVRWAPIIKDYAEPLKKYMYYFDLIPFSKTFFQGIEWFAKMNSNILILSHKFKLFQSYRAILSKKCFS
jgi:hypothetical protein